jgi:membrane-associated phospholipid phosphatase
MNYERIALIVSRLLDPFVMFVVVYCVLLWGHPSFVSVFLGMVGVPFVLFLVAWKTKWISNWDIQDRKERPKILWSLVFIECVAVIFFQLWHLTPILIGMVGFGVITHLWKISGHAMSVALAAGLIVVRFGWNWWPVLLCVPLMCWSRVVTKNHTIAQVIAGSIYGLFLASVMR